MENSVQDRLDLLSDVLRVYNTHLLLKDATNNEVMKELQHQNAEYSEKIVSDLNLIKKKLGIGE